MYTRVYTAGKTSGRLRPLEAGAHRLASLNSSASVHPRALQGRTGQSGGNYWNHNKLGDLERLMKQPAQTSLEEPAAEEPKDFDTEQ
jgi:hypothetical protein